MSMRRNTGGDRRGQVFPVFSLAPYCAKRRSRCTGTRRPAFTSPHPRLAVGRPDGRQQPR